VVPPLQIVPLKRLEQPEEGDWEGAGHAWIEKEKTAEEVAAELEAERERKQAAMNEGELGIALTFKE
jgi:hypothetical protein